MTDPLPPDLAASAELLRRAAGDDAPPTAVHARAVALDNMARGLARRGSAVLRRLVAVALPEDSSAGFAPAFGVRGAAADGRHWLFKAEECEIDLRVQQQGEHWGVAGQIFGMPQAQRVVLDGAARAGRRRPRADARVQLQRAGRRQLPPDGAGRRLRNRDPAFRHRRDGHGVTRGRSEALTSHSPARSPAALMSAAPAARGAIWQDSAAQPAASTRLGIEARCDAAWTADPAADRGRRRAGRRTRRMPPRRGGQGVGSVDARHRASGARADRGRARSAGARRQGFGAIGRPLEAAQTRISRLMALAMLGRYDDAIACGTEARAVFDDSGDSRAAGKIELNLGNLASRRDRHDDAVRHYGQALVRFAAVGDVELEVMATKGLAAMQARRHEFEPALALYRQAQAGAERGGFAVLAALIERDLGALELRRGRYDRALPSLEHSRATLARLELPHELALSEEWLGDAYLELNLLPEALALYERSLASYEKAGAVTDRAWALSQRGRALTLLGRHEAAAASLAQAERAFVNEHNPTGAAMVQLWRAELALRRGDTVTAAQQAAAAEPALLAARQMSAVLQARLLRAEALRGSGDAVQAEQAARAACATLMNST